ncbi:uncharacterized protein PHACADRAFT_164667 [Phanerochaete carnosa HHB-10118-sp]|uniref:RlpA-like protein double-psi beta-barrel domain-containing protein n=1 Tax=Phanerochaete carnosa (strain HHB-10118-sp) TaxID=650164 RepID=K5WQU9_PHACS|nr:uncharacterized protein PHACADRAFT_164667 [Phanerochaete carnosa HHB-10118-sp]EKM52742.1 hypothetical protein PHACADRAFT_164667 [Phanerochaete carnosa HHB-10118-sp]
MFFIAALLYALLAVVSLGNAAPAPVNSGDGTFFTPGLGACGYNNNESEHVAAVSHQFFDSFGGGSSNPNDAPICGKMATLHYGGKTTTVQIVDRCAGCSGPSDVDMAPAAFNDLADPSVGRIQITWTIN